MAKTQERELEGPGLDAKRLVAQRVLFAGPSPLVPHEMYAQVPRGKAVHSRASIDVGPQSTVSTNTYFGRFPASYWQRWTPVREVRLHAVLTGTGRIDVVATDVVGDTRVVATQSVVDAEAQRVELAAQLDRFVDGGALFVRLTTEDAELTTSDVSWSVDAPEPLRPTAVVICTFNRADDCVNTLDAIASDADALTLVDAVYVVDQGNDLVESRPRFAQLARTLGDKLHYLRQPNLGGAGGFTRGLYEVAEVNHADHANVLFMDDDILCEPDTVVRLTAFANRTSEPVIVGGQMLYLLHPDQLHVGAEYADLPTLTAGLPVPNALQATDVTRTHQEVRVDAGYNGWWSCLIPSEIMAKVGYPLPLFFQWDDIEYGYRARGAGHATVTLPGAGVWHADFHWKDWDEWHRYFNLRNSLITAALHSSFDTRWIVRTVLAQLTRYLICMQYGMAHTLLKAVEDFLRGPEELHDGGVEAAASVRKMRAEHPETIVRPASDVPGLRPSDAPIAAVTTPTGAAKRALLLLRLIDQVLGRAKPGPVSISAADHWWWHISQYDSAVVTDASQQGVRLRRRDRKKMMALARKGARVCLRLVREGKAVRRRYLEAQPKLTSRENWERLFGSSGTG
jgi:galactofuranosylgalactofuranosylrhamnosyl-N-acetylglucosaminyl-diphospho-decaprenol beta-1,5/1,6-galactofuranosyltransferase